MLRPLGIPGLLAMTPTRHRDLRGYFSEAFSLSAATAAGLPPFVQDNESWSARAGTIRGLHFQSPPHAQAKLVRCVRGAVLDVVVDIRRGSPTFGRHEALRLDAAEGVQLFVPEGFAHGFCTLEADCLVQYKVSAPYAPGDDHGLAWDDPALAIAWPATADDAVLSDRDRRHGRLQDLPDYFAF